ncbi:unnamed protein product [Rhizopus stolonifer]
MSTIDMLIFFRYGEIVHILLAREEKTGKSKGFAFLQYEDQRSTILAVDNMGGANIVGRTIRVDHSFGPKGKRKKDGEESEEEGPMMNVAPEYMEVGEEETKKKKKEKKKKAVEDSEDPMAEYFRKKKKKSKHHKRRRHERSQSPDENSLAEGSRPKSADKSRREYSPDKRRLHREHSSDEHRERSYHQRSRSRRSPSPEKSRRSRSPEYSRRSRRSRSPEYSRHSRSPRRR